MKVDVNINTILIPIEKIAKCGNGSIIDSNIPAGDSAQILVNDTLIGKGEIMVFEKNLALRINEILSSKSLIGSNYYKE